MEVKCDRCQGFTKPRRITSKKDGKEYTVYDCQCGCMSGKYKYSCFAPKDGGLGLSRGEERKNDHPQVQQPNLLLEISKKIDEIIKIMKSNSKVDDFGADNEIPF